MMSVEKRGDCYHFEEIIEGNIKMHNWVSFMVSQALTGYEGAEVYNVDHGVASPHVDPHDTSNLVGIVDAQGTTLCVDIPVNVTSYTQAMLLDAELAEILERAA